MTQLWNSILKLKIWSDSRGQDMVEYALAALDLPDTKLFVHCAAGVHRAPMMALALLRVLGWSLDDARRLIEERRPVADFADVYVKSVENFVRNYKTPTRTLRR